MATDHGQDLLDKLANSKKQTDSITIYAEAERAISALQANGYLFAEVKKINFVTNIAEVHIACGKQLAWKELSLYGLSPAVRAYLGRNNNVSSHFSPNELSNIFDKIITYYENNGYPFASIQLDSIVLNQDNIQAKLKISTHQLIKFDSLKIVGDAAVSSQFLQKYLAIKPGSLYAEQLLVNIDNQLQELPYLQMTQAPEVRFGHNLAKVLLYLNKKNANRFDGIIGVQQNGTSAKLEIVGKLDLQLANLFKIGEELKVNYQSFAQHSQSLDLTAQIPKFLNTDFSLLPSFQLLKQDSAYLNINSRIEAEYKRPNKMAIYLSLENRSSNLINPPAINSNSANLTTLDINTLFYGLGLRNRKLDNWTNPKKGYIFDVELATGNRIIKKNSALPDSIYHHLSRKSNAYKVIAKASHFFQPYRNWVMASFIQTGMIANNFSLENERFRLGGQKTLRGFNELSILADRYLLWNIEFRYLLGNNDYLFTFYNQALVHQKNNNQKYTDSPLGIGIGLSTETNLGILSISYAIGKHQNNPLNLRQGKIHVGISSFF